jgi:hypothetical protein
VIIISADGRVVFRQLATSKADRLSTAELVAQLDKSLGTHGPGLVDTRYAAIDRAQLRVDLGAGSVDSKTTGIATISALVPLDRYVIIGPRIGVDLRGAPLQIGGELALRLPLVRDTTTIEVGAVASYSEFKPAGAILGGIANLWFAYSPKWSIQIGVEVDSPSRVTGTFGIGRLLEF